jgi:hypothetical protein
MAAKASRDVIIPSGAESYSWFISRIYAFSKAWQKFESVSTVILYGRWYQMEHCHHGLGL